MAYSTELREQIVEAVLGGMTQAKAAETFGVSLATVERIMKVSRERWDLSPQKPPGRPRLIDLEDVEGFKAYVEQRKHLSLAHLAFSWSQDMGLKKPLSHSTVSRTFKRLGLDKPRSSHAGLTGTSKPRMSRRDRRIVLAEFASAVANGNPTTTKYRVIRGPDGRLYSKRPLPAPIHDAVLKLLQDEAREHPLETKFLNSVGIYSAYLIPCLITVEDGQATYWPKFLFRPADPEELRITPLLPEPKLT